MNKYDKKWYKMSRVNFALKIFRLALWTETLNITSNSTLNPNSLRLTTDSISVTNNRQNHKKRGSSTIFHIKVEDIIFEVLYLLNEEVF